MRQKTSSGINPQTIRRVVSGEGEGGASESGARREPACPAEARLSRRAFCNLLGLASAALLVEAAAVEGREGNDWRPAPQAFPAKKVEGAEYLLPGTALNFRYPTERDIAILVRGQEGQYHAFSQRCTHLSCPVYFERTRNRLECPCHEGAYDVRSGRVLFGPPPRPLERIELELRPGGEVWAVGKRAGG